MEPEDSLFELGKMALQKQSAYLKLKIEKELAGTGAFEKEEELMHAHSEWLKASENYRGFIDNIDLKKNLDND